MIDDGVIHFEGTPKELMNSSDYIVQEFLERTRTQGSGN
jgi:ABC-type transporter Mla maintaining outer membrane lipid asymmetry ATPase subunit MlaF